MIPMARRTLRSRPDRDRVEDGVDGDTGEELLLVQRDPQLVVRLLDLGVELVEAA